MPSSRQAACWCFGGAPRGLFDLSWSARGSGSQLSCSAERTRKPPACIRLTSRIGIAGHVLPRCNGTGVVPLQRGSADPQGSCPQRVLPRRTSTLTHTQRKPPQSSIHHLNSLKFSSRKTFSLHRVLPQALQVTNFPASKRSLPALRPVKKRDRVETLSGHAQAIASHPDHQRRTQVTLTTHAPVR
jgi:hypothetical protein